MTDDLVKRLRDETRDWISKSADRMEAAARIEALTAALTAVVDEYEIQMHGPALHSIEAANAVLNTGKADT